MFRLRVPHVLRWLPQSSAALDLLQKRTQIAVLAGIFAGAAVAALPGLPAGVTPGAPAQQKRAAKPQGSRKVVVEAQPVDAAVPFRAGETLEYAAQWNKFVTAATIKVAVLGRNAFYGRNAWHFQSSARTIDLVRLLYALDDQFDSYTDAASLSSMQYESYIREQTKRQDLIVPMASATPPAKNAGKRGGKAVAKADPKNDDVPLTRGDTHIYLVLPGTRDPLGLFYSLRAQDWQREPSMRFPVFDGRRYYDVAAEKESAGGEVEVAAGKFHVTRVALRVFEGGKEIPNVKFWVSLAQDAAHTPVLIESELPFGTVRVELTAIK